MGAEIIDGKQTAAEIRASLKQQIEAFDGEDMPVLAVVRVGDDDAGRVYVRNKKKAAEEVGIGCEILEFAGSIGENALLESVAELNDNPHINGIIVQQPLPKQINPQKILEAISPDKDVDGFGALNIGKTALKESGAVSAATPKGIIRLLDKYCGDLRGKHAVIIGRSNIVGRPLALLLLNRDCTVTVCHSKTQDLPKISRTADILIAACGCPKMVQKDWIKPGAAVIDVGINRDENGKLCGDVDFDAVKENAGFITPVPGGVGPMTVAMLLENTWEAYKKQQTGQTSSCCCGHHHCHCGHH